MKHIAMLSAYLFASTACTAREQTPIWLDVNQRGELAINKDTKGPKTITVPVYAANMETLENTGEIVAAMSRRGILPRINMARGKLITKNSACIRDYESLLTEKATSFFSNYKIMNQSVTPLEPPISFRQETRQDAWRLNNWFEIHYVILGLSHSYSDEHFNWLKDASHTTVSVSFQVLAGPQHYEKEMRDITNEDDVITYYQDKTRQLVAAIAKSIAPLARSCGKDPFY